MKKMLALCTLCSFVALSGQVPAEGQGPQGKMSKEEWRKKGEEWRQKREKERAELTALYNTFKTDAAAVTDPATKKAFNSLIALSDKKIEFKEARRAKMEQWRKGRGEKGRRGKKGDGRSGRRGRKGPQPSEDQQNQ